MKNLNKLAKLIIWGTLIILFVLFIVLPKTTILEKFQIKDIEKTTKQLETESNEILNDINKTLNELEDIK